MIRVMIVDDQRLMREGLAAIIGLEPDIQVCGTASDGGEALERAMEWKPDVVLMDIRMPQVDGVEGTRRIRASLPAARILILTTFSDSELIYAALQEGASGYLLKDAPSETIVSAIRTVAAGGVVLEADVTRQIMEEWKKSSAVPAAMRPDSPEAAAIRELTDRERDVLSLLGLGLNNKEIADRLFLSEGTVKNHVSNVIAKIALRDRTQAAVFAVRHGLTTPED